MTSSVASPWLPGRRIDAYVLLREIARGGMGEIWLALDRSGVQLERLVVIKRVLRASDDDPHHVALFLDEARIASQLQHPNVVQVFTMGEFEGAPYLVMEYLPGQTLGRVVRAYGKLHETIPVALAARIIADAAKGLGYAHRRKALDGKPLRIVHRDVSPQNVLVTYDGLVKVLDFGIAVAEGRMSRTATGVVRGKIAYMAPEQAMGLPLTAHADVFALGVILWELATGKRLHGEADDLAVLRRLAMDSGELPNVRSHGEVEPGLAAIISCALRRVPEQRYVDGLALSEALEGWLATHPVPSPLGVAMERIFGDEIRGLPELQRAVTVTPSVGVEREMPMPMPMTKTTPGAPLSIDVPLVTSESALQRRVRGSSARPVLALGVVAALGVIGALVLTREVVPEVVPDAGTTAAATPVAQNELVDAGALEVDAGLGSVVQVAMLKVELGERLARLRLSDPSVAAEVEALAAELEAAGTIDAHDVVKQRFVQLEAESAERRKKRPEPARAGTLSLDTEPWTRVFLGKRFLGETPLVELQVPSGALRLHLVNEPEGIDTFIDVKVAPGAVTTKQYRLK